MNKNYQLHVEAKAEAGFAQIRLVDRISEQGDASPTRLRTLIDGFLADGVKRSKVYINSKGGSVLAATEIVNELKRFDEVEITVGSIAASAATRILSEFKTGAYPTSQFMIHRPRLGTYGDVNQIKNDVKMLQNATADYKAAYAKKFNKTEDEVEALWANGDKWLTAQEALKLGLIDEIISDKKQNITAEDVAVLEACGCPTIPKIKTETKIEMDINKMRSVLGLDATATEEQVLEAAKAAKAKADKAKELEAEASANAKLRAEALVDAGIVAKKFGADKRESMVALAVADYDNAKTMIDAMQVVPKLSSEIKGGEGGNDADREKWDLDAWLENDPDGLDALADSDPEKFKKINGL